MGDNVKNKPLLNKRTRNSNLLCCISCYLCKAKQSGHFTTVNDYFLLIKLISYCTVLQYIWNYTYIFVFEDIIANLPVSSWLYCHALWCLNSYHCQFHFLGLQTIAICFTNLSGYPQQSSYPKQVGGPVYVRPGKWLTI